MPQGSCLGPLLFVLYVSKLFEIVEHHLPDVHAYADDSQHYVSFKSDLENQSAAIEAMQKCISDVRRWMLADRLKLNDDKTEIVIIGTKQQLAKVNTDASVRVGMSTIPPSSEVRNLGS